jgi:hypothetical protein
MCGLGKKIIQLSVCPINGMLVTITHNSHIAATKTKQMKATALGIAPAPTTKQIKKDVAYAYNELGQTPAFYVANSYGVGYEYCKACETDSPSIEHECLICGQTTAPAPKNIDIICYPEGNIVKVTSDQLKELMEKGLVFYDDEWTEEKPNGQYGFNQENEDEIMKLTGSPAPISREVEGFTPGEWEAKYNTELFPGQAAIYGNDGDENGRVIAVMDTSDETDTANIDLVCSAPTLYRENQRLNKLVEAKTKAFTNISQQYHQQGKDIELLREALQKSMEIIDRLGEEYSTVANKHSSYTRGEYNSLNKALKQTEPKQ